VERAGLIRRRRDGRLHRCTLKSRRLKEAEAWIEHHRHFWEASLDALVPSGVRYHGDVALRTSDLLARLKARDPVVLREVVDQQARRLYRAARGMGFSGTDAEDLAQDVFMTFLDTIDRFEGRAQVGTWLFGILYHKAQERRRSRARDDLGDPIDDTFEARFDAKGSWVQPPTAADRLVESQAAARALIDCLSGVPLRQREVFQLRQVEELPAADVAHMLGCTVSHVGVLLHRARLRLRACLEAKGWGRSR
jgi:RNA polymerase sigma-70 factor (ECF subfamily)